MGVDLKAGNSCGKALSGTFSIAKTGPSVKADESDRLPAAAEEIDDQVHDIYTKGSPAAQGEGGGFRDNNWPSKRTQRL